MSQHKTVFSSPIKRIVRSKKSPAQFFAGHGFVEQWFVE